MLSLILVAWLSVFSFMCVIWLLYLKLKNPGVIDFAWSVAITLASSIYLIATPFSRAQIIFTILLFLWMFRLAGYLLLTRILPGHVEKRYINLSRNWKIKKKLGFFLNYQFQGILAVIMATPFLFINQLKTFSIWQIIASILIIIGISGESLADQQLQKFRKNHKGKVCNVSLWHYSRHPNYFFEWLIWLGFAFAVFSIPLGWLAFLAPILLLFIMLKITGPITERSSIQSRGKLYLDYQRKTSMFLPLPPKN